MNDNTSIYICDTEIPFVPNNKDLFLNKLTICYGASGTGKSVLVLHLLHLLRKSIPIAIVANPTNRMNQTYSGIFPDATIYDRVTKDLLKNIYSRQDAVSDMYKKVNNIKILKTIFMKCATNEEQNKLDQYNKTFTKTKEKIESSSEHISIKRSKISKLEDMHEKATLHHLKMTINENKLRLESSGILSNTELSYINNLNINPNLLILFDDCGDHIKEWQKFEETQTLFFNARHYNITTIITLQDDKLLNSELRKNTHINFFTAAPQAIAYFNRPANNFSIKDKKLMNCIVDEIFKEDENSKYKNHKKLCYFSSAITGQKKKAQYIIATLHNKFKFGSEQYWELSTAVEKKIDERSNTNNMFSRLFKNE